MPRFRGTLPTRVPALAPSLDFSGLAFRGLAFGGLAFGGLALAGFALAGLLLPAPAAAQTRVGEVSTTFRMVGPNDKVVVERYDDPRVPNVSCYVSRAETGGVSGWVGLAEDPSRFSIACRATGAVAMPAGIPQTESVFRQSSSPLFKALTVTRIVDAEKRVLVYLITSTKLVDGSPFNSVTAVPIEAPPR